MQVFLDPEITGDQLIATLAHEFQHVVEISDAPSVVSDRTLSDHYREIGILGRTNGEEWDTLAAKEAGRQVRRELGS